jgi:uncharacterized repeat protein (TIGR04042 family)
MPERHFDIQWPNGEQQSYYSPSSTISNYLIAGQTYPLKKFIHTLAPAPWINSISSKKLRPNLIRY